MSTLSSVVWAVTDPVRGPFHDPAYGDLMMTFATRVDDVKRRIWGKW